MSHNPKEPESLQMWKSKETIIAMFTILMIIAYLGMRFITHSPMQYWNMPLIAVLILGGIPLVYELLVKMIRLQFGSDLLAGISIIVSAILGEYMAGSLVVLMLSGGEALEAYAVRSASSVLQALSKRMPSIAHRKINTVIEDIELSNVQVGDLLTVFPHEICPVDGTVIEGHGVMDESYLTGEPYMMSKTPGSLVLSGTINGESALVIRAEKLAIDSRYSKIMKVMETSEQHKPHIRRIADTLGAWYTPLAVAIGLIAWITTGNPTRFLAVMVVATPCPLLIAIPVTIIGSISRSARRAIIIRDPSALETADTCKTLIFDKTGTLTFGEPHLVEQLIVDTYNKTEVLALVSSIERFSKHPLATAILEEAKKTNSITYDVAQVLETPGQGLQGEVDGKKIAIHSRKQCLLKLPESASMLPEITGGLECIIVIDNSYAGTYRFRDTPRPEAALFIKHLLPKHGISKVMLVSGDRESEVMHLAEQVGIKEVYANKSPEEKLAIVNAETAKQTTMFIGDGINDAPALMAATVGVAMGQNSDVTTEAADVVILDSSLQKIDEFIHISKRMRRIAFQSAIGGMTISVIGMIFASLGYLPPVAGAITQEVIDVFAVVNALRTAFAPKVLSHIKD